MQFSGVRTGGRAQVREWPRKPITADQAYNRQDAWGAPRVPYGYKGLPYPATVFDLDGNPIPTDAVPAEIEYATYEAALRELTSPGGLSPDYVYSGRVTSERIGPIGVTYAGPMNGADDVRPVVTIIDDILAPLIATKMQYLSGPSGRA